MQPIKKCLFACILIFLLLIASSCSLPAPYLTLISIMPPKDFDSVLIINDNIEISSHKTKVAWEVYCVFWIGEFYQPPDEPYTGKKVETAVLRVTAHGETFDININKEIFRNNSDTIAIDIGNKSIMYGTPPSRDLFLVSLRVVLLLAVAIGVFYLFGYRKKRSWIALFAIRLPGAFLISCMIIATNVGPYRSTFPFFLPLFGAPILLLTLIAMCIAINEHKRTKTALYVVTASFINYVIYCVTQHFLPF